MVMLSGISLSSLSGMNEEGSKSLRASVATSSGLVSSALTSSGFVSTALGSIGFGSSLSGAATTSADGS